MLWWNESLATGMEVIDQQHKSIFEKAEEILSLEETADETSIRKTFNFLIGYTITHFAEEEKIMMQRGYPAFLEHREEHTYFMKELYKVANKINEEGIQQEAVETLKLLTIEWLVNHISEADKKFVNFLANRTEKT